MDLWNRWSLFRPTETRLLIHERVDGLYIPVPVHANALPGVHVRDEGYVDAGPAILLKDDPVSGIDQG